MGSRHPMAGAVRAHYIRWAVYMLLFGLLPGLRVDTAAHVGGLAAGFGVAYLAGVQRLETLLRERIWRWAMYVVLLLTAYCFLRMYFFFERAAAQF